MPRRERNFSESIGIYIHVPFCKGKCPYCDFYSLSGDDALYDDYIRALSKDMRRFAQRDIFADTLYIGGGTPSAIGGGRLAFIIESAASAFSLCDSCEITVELNPADVDIALAQTLKSAGFNRVSMGVQSGIDTELKALGRRHDAKTAETAVSALSQAGFENISLDLMLGIPLQTEESLKKSIDFFDFLQPEHISAYILKIEPRTPFAHMQSTLALPDEDEQSELYLSAVERLEAYGYAQYEISNFSRRGFESRHNLKYWDCREYIGFGPSAHSFFGGRRFFYPRSLEEYIASPKAVDDGEGGSLEEYIMLRLRLSDGLHFDALEELYAVCPSENALDYAEKLQTAGLLICDGDRIRLLPKGFLVSNSIIGELIERLAVN